MIHTRWRKSSYSGNQGNCVELADTFDAVRDSKNHQVLVLSRQAVAGLLREVRPER